MRVKVGETWFDWRDVPICVELSDDDKRNLSNMPAHCTRYALFPEDTTMTQDEMREWMGSPGAVITMEGRDGDA